MAGGVGFAVRHVVAGERQHLDDAADCVLRRKDAAPLPRRKIDPRTVEIRIDGQPLPPLPERRLEQRLVSLGQEVESDVARRDLFR